MFNQLADKITAGKEITFEQALALTGLEGDLLYGLFLAALRITRYFHANKVDLCSIINAKSGRCSEDCAFCAQSGYYQTGIQVHPLLSEKDVLKRALEMESKGVRRFSLVTSGKGITDGDFRKVLHIYKTLSEKTGLRLCASLGILDRDRATRLKEAGVTRYHHNIETSRSYFSKICTTHTFKERVETIRSAKAAGLEICSGGIIGLGENWNQRIEMAFQLKELGVLSIPVNILTPIKGTPLWGQSVPAPMEILKTIALYRLILPEAVIRLGGGRGPALRDLQCAAFTAGANGLLTGDYLTTAGREVPGDRQMLEDLELQVL